MTINHVTARPSTPARSAATPSGSDGSTTVVQERRRKAPADAPDMPSPRKQRLNAAGTSSGATFRRVDISSMSTPDKHGTGTSASAENDVQLLDNRATLEKMGIEHPLLNHSWHDPMPSDVTSTENQALIVQRGEPATPSAGQTSEVAHHHPAAPQLTPSQRVAVERARTQVRGALQGSLTKLQQALDRNLDLEVAQFPIKKVDWALVPLLMASENARNPGLNLVALHMDTAETSFDDDDEDELPPMVNSHNFGKFIESAPPGRYRAVVNDGPHTRAADIRKDSQGTTVIVVDPSRKEKDENEYDGYADNISSEAGQHAKCAFIPVDLQKSAFGCRIFSMSLALKMHAREADFTALHDALRTGSDPGPLVSRSKTTEELGALLVLDGAPLIDASMMKHSHARSSVRRYLSEHPDQAEPPVNKKQETLEARTNRHLVERHVLNRVDNDSSAPAQPFKTAKLSTSIEHKRVSLLNRAVAYLDSAPPQAVAHMTKLLRQANQQQAKP